MATDYAQDVNSPAEPLPLANIVAPRFGAANAVVFGSGATPSAVTEIYVNRSFDTVDGRWHVWESNNAPDYAGADYPGSSFNTSSFSVVGRREVGAVEEGGTPPVGGSYDWTPYDIWDSVDLWLDAADATTITQGTGVSAWADKGPNKYSAEQGAAGSQPAYDAAGLGAGYPALVFDGADDFLQLVGAEHMEMVNAGTSVFAVMKDTGSTDYSAIFSIGSNTNADTFRTSIVIYSTLQAGGRRLDSNSYQELGAAVPAGAVVVGGIFDYQNAELYLDIDGVVTARGGFQTAGVSDSLLAISTGIGATATTSSQFTGSISEILVVRGVVDQATREYIEGYLAHKWGLTGNLDGAHPYKTTMPTGTVDAEPADPVFVNTNKHAQARITRSGRGVTSMVNSVPQITFGSATKSAGKWYFECYMEKLAGGSVYMVGIAGDLASNATIVGDPESAGYRQGGYIDIDDVRVNASAGAYVAGDTIQVAYDLDAMKIWFGKNGTWVSGDPATDTGGYDLSVLDSITFAPAVTSYFNTVLGVCNFLEADLQYTLPTGFSALG